MRGHVKEQDDEDDKDDGSTHATVVAESDLAETTKLQGEQEALEKHKIR